MRVPALLLAACGLLAAAGGTAGDVPASAERAPAGIGAQTWSALGEEALAAFEMEDIPRARAAVGALAAIDPDHPVTRYLSARLAEQSGDHEAALQHYGEILAGTRAGHASRWARLAAANWVRARSALTQERVRAALLRPPQQEPKRGRCLILPLEPIFVAQTSETDAEQMRALGVTIAAWLVDALARLPGTEPVDLPVVHLLRRALAGSVQAGPAGGPGADVDAGRLPPISTVLGVTTRLAGLKPAGPPPGAEGEAAPRRYLETSPGGEWTDEAAAALAHFQIEHDLPATGIADPETRAALERAYRRERRALTLPALPADVTDPGRAMARLLGAESLLSGTLEANGAGEIRWQLAWVSAADGSLLGNPESGSLPRNRFEEAFMRMQRLVLAGSPYCPPAGRVEAVELPAAPTLAGARSYGQALLLVDEGRIEEASSQFTAAAREGAGEQAAWFAMAWSVTDDEARLLERDLLDEGIHGPVELPPGLLAREGRGLAADLTRAAPQAGSGARWGTGLTFLPETGWIHVHGRVEAP